MNDDEMVARLRAIFATGDMEEFGKAMAEMLSDDAVQEWPQSGERIRGKDNILAVARGYEAGSGTSPKATLRRILKPGEAWVIESTIDYGDGTPVSVVQIIETNAEGKVVRDTDYFANPFEAPEWRRQWVETMEPAGVR